MFLCLFSATSPFVSSSMIPLMYGVSNTLDFDTFALVSLCNDNEAHKSSSIDLSFLIVESLDDLLAESMIFLASMQGNGMNIDSGRAL